MGLFEEKELSVSQILGELLLGGILTAIGWWTGIAGGALALMVLAVSGDGTAGHAFAVIVFSPVALLGCTLAGVALLDIFNVRIRRKLGCCVGLVFPFVAWTIWTLLFGGILLWGGLASAILLGLASQ